MESKTIRVQEPPASKHLLVVDCLQVGELPRGFERMAPRRPLLWIAVESQTRMIHDIQLHELYSLLLKHGLPRLIVTDNGRALRNGRKGAAGDVQ